MKAEGEAEAKREELDVDALVGTVVNGRFHIVKRIARGGMANVYFATQAPLSRPVAVKVLHGVRSHDVESEARFRGRFLREASILAKLQHPNIVMLLDYGQITDLPGEHYFMAMEYLRGETLAQRFRTRRRLSVEESIRIARQIGRGLREAHRCGIVHRDLKPSNMILVPEDERNDIVKLVDFGIGKIVPGASDLLREGEDVTRAGLLLGSPRYMAPEQIRSEPVESRTDLYALGVILFQALTGRLPFEAKTEFDVMIAHCLTEAPTLHQASPDQYYPDSLSRLVASLLKKSASSRPTVEEFLQRLAEVEEEVFGVVHLAGPTLQGRLPTLPPMSSRGDAVVESERRRSTLPPLPKGRESSPTVNGAPLPLLAPAPLPARRGKHLGTAAVALLGVLGVLGAVALFVRVRDAYFGRPVLEARAAVAARIPPAGDAASVEIAASSSSFELTIESNPSRATVTEAGTVLGVTPLRIAVERASVATAPRRFVVSHEGFSPFTLEQADSEMPVRAFAVLNASSRSAGARWRAGRAPATSPRAMATPSGAAAEPLTQRRNEGGNLEIRMRR